MMKILDEVKMNFKLLYEKYKDAIPYMLFGVLTTGINILSYWILAHLFNWRVMESTVVAWAIAVMFAYLTNRKWVFESDKTEKREILKEMFSFVLCRIMTGVIDWICMYFFVDVMNFNDVFIKFVSNVVVIVLNYLASKCFIFKHK